MREIFFATLAVAVCVYAFSRKEEVAFSKQAITRHPATPVRQEVHVREAALAKASPVVEMHDHFAEEEFAEIPALLPRGTRYLPYVKATPSDTFRPELGKVLLTRNNMVFFRSQRRDSGFSHVVYDQRRNTYHPVTDTIKVTGVSEEKRAELAAAFGEHYYHPETQTLYVESNPELYLQHVEDLKGAGASPEVEVVRSVYIPK